MKKVLFFILSSVLTIICVMLLGAYAIRFVVYHDFSADYLVDIRLIWFQGNNNYFYLLSFISASIILDIMYNIFLDKKSREKRKEKRRLSRDEKISFSHIASKHEIKKGLQRIEFDSAGQIKERTIRSIMDDMFNWYKHIWNTAIRKINDMKIKGISISDVHLMNEKKYWMIDGKKTRFRTGVPLYTYHNRVYVDADDSHSIIVGTTNSGKTYSVIHILIELSRMSGESMIINDMKGELLKAHRGSLINDGYEIIELNFVDPTNSDGWNIFGLIVKKYREAAIDWLKNVKNGSLASKPNYSEAKELLRDLCNNLYYDENAKDKFWNQKGADLLEGVVLFMLEETTAECIRNFKKTEFDLASKKRELDKLDVADSRYKSVVEDVMKIEKKLSSYEDIPTYDKRINAKSAKLIVLEGNKMIVDKVINNTKIITSLFKKYVESFKNTEDDSVMKLSDFINAPENTKGSILSVFTSKLDMILVNENITKMISNQTFNMDDIGKKKTAVFICVHDEKTTYYSLVTIFIKQLYEEIIKVSRIEDNLRLKVPINIIYDEFGISPALKDIQAMLAAMRSRGVRMNMVIQDYSQLDKNYGKDGAATIKNNVMNTIYLLGGDNATLDEISKKSGRRLVWNKEKGSYDTEPLISVDRLGKLSLGEAVIIRQRKNPYITRLLPYSSYNFYKNITKMKNVVNDVNGELLEVEVISLEKMYQSIRHVDNGVVKEVSNDDIKEKLFDYSSIKKKCLGSDKKEVE